MPRLSSETTASDRTAPGVSDESGRSATSRPATRLSFWLWPALVVALFCVPLFVGLGRTDLANDEAIYSYAVDMILQSGDWLTPKAIPREDVAFLEKPPLKFWIVAAPIRLGILPHNEFGLRFWDAVFGSLAFLYVFAIGRRLGGPLCGIVAVLLLFTHRPLVFEHGLRSNTMEAALLLSYCGAIYHFMVWRDTDTARRRRRHVFLVSLYFVLGFMTKFVAVLFLPTVLAAAILFSRNDRTRLRREWRVWGAAASFAVALIAPWFLYQYHQFGADLWKIILGQQVYTRFTTYVDPTHLKPWHFYFSQMFQELQVSGTVVIALAGLALVLLRTIRSGWREGVLILLWFGLPLSLISFGSSKLYHYAYPFLPPVALAGGYVAALVLDFGWTLLSRPLPVVEQALARAARSANRSRVLRIVLLAIALTAVAVATATYVVGHVYLAVGNVVLLRNASLLRPCLIAILALTLAGSLGTAIRIAAVLVVVALMPSSEVYRQELAALPAEHHPLRSLRDCLQPIGARSGAPDGRGPGVWVEHEQLTHPFYYYLRSLGPWTRPDGPSAPTVYMHLYVPSKLRPVLLSHSRYKEFAGRVRSGDPGLVEEAARQAGVDPSRLAATAEHARMAALRFQYEVLILPGPYEACAPEQAQRVAR